MRLLQGMLGALALGLVGSGLWMGVTYATGWEFGLMAIVLGGLAGFGMGTCSQGRGGVAGGLLAAVAACAAVLVGKLGVAHLVVQNYVNSEEAAWTEEDAYAAYMDDAYQRFESEGWEMTTLDEETGYPVEVVVAANDGWSSMNESQREAYRAEREGRMKADLGEMMPVATAVAFVFSFGVFDLVIFGLALATAYKGGSVRAVRGNDGQWSVVESGGAAGLHPSLAAGPEPIPGGGDRLAACAARHTQSHADIHSEQAGGNHQTTLAGVPMSPGSCGRTSVGADGGASGAIRKPLQGDESDNAGAAAA